MRAGFGLVGILICIGVIVWFMGPGGFLQQQKSVIDTGEKARTQVSQFAGQDSETGRPARDTVSLQVETSNGKIQSLLITEVVPGGAYERFWGLQRKDSIVGLGNLGDVRGMITSKGEGEDMLLDAYQHRQPLNIVRFGQKMTLPLPTKDAPAPGAKPSKPSGDPIQDQLDLIKNQGR